MQKLEIIFSCKSAESGVFLLYFTSSGFSVWCRWCKQCIHRSFDLSLDFLPELCEIEIMTFLPGVLTCFSENFKSAQNYISLFFEKKKSINWKEICTALLNVNKLTRIFFAERLSETCLDTHYVNCQLMFHSFSFSISVSSTEFVIILKLRNFVYQTARLNVRPFHFKNMNKIVIKKSLNSNGISYWFFSANFMRKVEVKKNWKVENVRNFQNFDEWLMTRSYFSIHSATFNFDKVNKIKAKKSNGEFLQSEELTRKITFSATYTIFANHKIAGISFFTFFRVFSTIFVELHSKIFSPQKNL